MIELKPQKIDMKFYSFESKNGMFCIGNISQKQLKNLKEGLSTQLEQRFTTNQLKKGSTLSSSKVLETESFGGGLHSSEHNGRIQNKSNASELSFFSNSFGEQERIDLIKRHTLSMQESDF